MAPLTHLESDTGRQQLAAFLRSRRARLVPAEVGLPQGARRRTPGLRREEVAQLAGIGVTWYTWFEQGRAINVSAQFLENLARALQLSAAERNHLFVLAQNRPPPLSALAPPAITPALQRMLETLPNPAYIRTRRWDVAAWNRPMTQLCGDYARLDPAERNLLRQIFLAPRFRQVLPDWEADARRALARFRLDAAQANGDPDFAAMIRDLTQQSPEFAQWWPQQDMPGYAEGVKRLRHAEVGEIEFEHTAFLVSHLPDLTLVVFTPVAGVSKTRARRLFAKRR